MKKTFALALIAALLALVLCGCGENAEEIGAEGVYSLTGGESYGEEIPAEELPEWTFDLAEGGSGSLIINGEEIPCEWSSDNETVVIKIDGMELIAVLESNTITFEDWAGTGAKLAFTRPDAGRYSISEALLMSVTGMLIVFAVLVILICVILIMSAFMKKGKKSEKAAIEAPKSVQTPLAAPSSAPQIAAASRFDCDDRTAAMIMAIVADKMGEKVEDLTFLSISEIPSKTKAAIMAIVADKMGEDPSNLVFKSIKEVK